MVSVILVSFLFPCASLFSSLLSFKKITTFPFNFLIRWQQSQQGLFFCEHSTPPNEHAPLSCGVEERGKKDDEWWVERGIREVACAYVTRDVVFLFVMWSVVSCVLCGGRGWVFVVGWCRCEWSVLVCAMVGMRDETLWWVGHEECRSCSVCAIRLLEATTWRRTGL